MGVLSTLRNFFNMNGNKKSQASDQTTSKTERNGKVKSLQPESVASKKETISNSVKNDSDSKSSITSPTTSTKQQTSSAGYSYKYKDGRRYHADETVAYVLPNDDSEADRVHEQHWILRHLLNGNFFSPVEKQLEEGINVLDSGCGPATWAFEMAETYPRSTIYGIDASCVFPEDIKPVNVEFTIGNIAKELPFEDNFFDFIHQRLLMMGLTSDDWTMALLNLHRVLKPGGYIELAEPDMRNLFEAGPSLNTLQTTLQNMSIARSLPPHIASELKERLQKAGFVDVVVKITDIPLNHSGKVGELLWGDYKHAYLNLKPVMSKVNPAWENGDDYEAHINKCGEEAKASKACLRWYSIYAKKPEQDGGKQNDEAKNDSTETA